MQPNESLSLGYESTGSGTYSLSNTGQLFAPVEAIGCYGVGYFAQSGGTNTISQGLCIGVDSGSGGTYTLGNTGQLLAPYETIGCGSGVSALFQQTGGTNNATQISVGSAGQYQLSGGTLQINANGGFDSQGSFDGCNSSAAIVAGNNTIVDFSKGTLQNTAAPVDKPRE